MNENEVMQAIVAALLFHEDIGIASQADYRSDGQSATVFPGASNIVSMDEGARSLLAKAWTIAKDHMEPVDPNKYGTCNYDIASWMG